MTIMYHDGNRRLQDQFDSRRISDRLEEKLTRTAFTADDKAFIESTIYFFLSTADAEGQPGLLVQGRAAGLRARHRPTTRSRFPDYDGNGMFKSLGNLLVNPNVGLLFIDLHERPRRLRVNGSATVSRDDPLLGETVGAQTDRARDGARDLPELPALHSEDAARPSRRSTCRSRASIRSSPPGRASTCSRATCTRGSRRRRHRPIVMRTSRQGAAKRAPRMAERHRSARAMRSWARFAGPPSACGDALCPPYGSRYRRPRGERLPMTSPVAVPLWLMLIVSALALWAVLDHVLMPALRAFMRRRFNRAIEDLNTRLKLRIQPFKLAKRQALIDQLIFDPEVLRAVEAYAAENKVPREVAQQRARRYAQEIVPSFSAYAYFGIGTRLARWVSTFLYRVRLGYLDEQAMASADPDSAVIFVINHRSNMDYVLVTYMASSSSALSYAVGEWARVWLLQNLIRSMGAYFVRRDSREPLYRKVLSRYVHLAIAGGLTQAMFPEGGLTRDGKLRPPKLGLLSYMVSCVRSEGPARRGVRARRDQLRPRDRGPRAGRRADDAGGREAALQVLAEGADRLSGAQRRAAAARQALSLRLCLRQLRQADLAAPVRHRARHRLPHARREPPLRRDRAAGRDADAESRRGRAGASGVAGRDRRARRRQAALRARAESRGRRADGAARPRAARTSISRAPIRTTRSRWACACCCCAISCWRRTGSIAPIRAKRSCCATTPIRSRI